eukprot:4484884-Alexandrium_andersonii.AAC.1
MANWSKNALQPSEQRPPSGPDWGFWPPSAGWQRSRGWGPRACLRWGAGAAVRCDAGPSRAHRRPGRTSTGVRGRAAAGQGRAAAGVRPGDEE